MKTKSKAANVIANASNFLVNWRPFNHKPITSIYKWAHKVRSNDPAWHEFVRNQDDSIIAPVFMASETPEATA